MSVNIAATVDYNIGYEPMPILHQLVVLVLVVQKNLKKNDARGQRAWP